MAWSTSVRNKAHLISLSFLAQINPTTLWLKSFFLCHTCVLDGQMLYIDSDISGIFMFALLSIPGNLTIPWWSLCEHSTNLCTVNLLLVVAIKIICGCFSQPLYFNSAVTRFVIRTFLLSSCVFSEAGVSKVITKITLLPLTVAKKTKQNKFTKAFFL